MAPDTVGEETVTGGEDVAAAQPSSDEESETHAQNEAPTTQAGAAHGDDLYSVRNFTV